MNLPWSLLPKGWRKSHLFGFSVFHTKYEDILKQVKKGMYESESVNIVKDWCTNSCVAFDIGANIGLFSLQVISQTADKNPLIIAFEPNPITFTKLQLAVIENNLYKTLIPYPFALSDNQQIDLFSIHQEKSSSGDGLLDTGRAGPTEQTLVQTTTIDTLDSVLQLDRLDWMKIDVEGSELLVLKGAENTLLKYKPKIIFEIHKDNIKPYGIRVEEIYSFLIKCNYQLFSTEKVKLDLDKLQALVMNNSGSGNYLAIPEKFLAI